MLGKTVGKRAITSRYGDQQITVVVSSSDGEARERNEVAAAGGEVVAVAPVFNVTEARDLRKAPRPLIETLTGGELL